MGAPQKIKMSELRAQYPMYADKSDEQLILGIKKKFYPDLPAAQLADRIEFDTDPNSDPTTGMSGSEKFFAGYAKPFVDIQRSARRIGNKLGFNDYDQAAAEEDERLDKPLMKTGAGQAGAFTGELAATLLPGIKGAQGITKGMQAAGKVLPRAVGALTTAAAPYVSAATVGGLTGSALSPEDMGGGAKTGAAFGVAGELGGRALSGLYSGAKAVFEPLYEGGRKRILKRTLERFVKDPDSIGRAAKEGAELVPGYSPTLAEATGDAGIAQLQRAAQTMPDVASELAEANKQRIAAYRQALDDIAGDDVKREFFNEAREQAAKMNYGKAYAEGLNLTPELADDLTKLTQRPSIKSAIPKSRKLAAEKQLPMTNPKGSVAGLHAIKMQLDDDIAAAMRSGNDQLANAIRGTQDELVGALQRGSKPYAEAMAEYEAMSRPLNQMAVGQKLRETLFPSLTDFSDDLLRTRGESFATAVGRGGDDLAKSATGLRSATLEGTLDPQQLANVRGIARDQARNTAAQEAGKIVGSPTAQYLGARNIIQGMLGPLGLPETALDHTLGRVATGMLSLPFKLTASETEQMLAKALRDPKVAAALMQTKDNPTLVARLLQPYAAQIAIQANTE